MENFFAAAEQAQTAAAEAATAAPEAAAAPPPLLPLPLPLPLRCIARMPRSGLDEMHALHALAVWL